MAFGVTACYCWHELTCKHSPSLQEALASENLQKYKQVHLAFEAANERADQAESMLHRNKSGRFGGGIITSVSVFLSQYHSLTNTLHSAPPPTSAAAACALLAPPMSDRAILPPLALSLHYASLVIRLQVPSYTRTPLSSSHAIITIRILTPFERLLVKQCPLLVTSLLPSLYVLPASLSSNQ